MADGAHPRPATAPFRVSCAPAATSPINATPLKNASKRAFFAGWAGAASAATIVAIVSFSVYATVRKRRSKQPSYTDTHSFCCPDEVGKIARYLNTSVGPCDDFFAYVCSSSIELGRYKHTSLDFRLDSATITRVMPPNVTMLKAGSFLYSSYETCVKTTSQRESFATSLASALLQEAGGLLKKVDSRSAMVFNVAASLTYSLTSGIDMFYQGTGSVLMAIDLVCNPDTVSLDCLNATVDALKYTTNSTATTMGTAKLAATLWEQGVSGHCLTRNSFRYSTATTTARTRSGCKRTSRPACP
ncbi:uncharacterized protein [Dermacentor albipictus]|uniref:uncharacterized protein n=1 Tax=Dermacentor albipictus TaxID=60249 RepID=UPI0031FD634C